MMGLLTLGGFVNGFRKSLLAQIAMGVIALLGVWKINNHFVAKGAIKKVVQASEKAGKKRNDKSRKIRRTTTASNAAKRLREYARTD